MSLVKELKRRNVFRVAAAYLVVGWLLTEVLTTILPTLGAPDWTTRAIILIFAFGFIPAVVLSWVYEITPEGVKREKDLDRDDPKHRGKVKKLDYLTIAAVILAIVFFASFSAQQLPDDSAIVEEATSNESVAVLPFVNMSKDKDNEYFSDGLTETLLHMLAQYPELKVAARTSSFAFKGQNTDIREIASALQVAHILEGSVQQVGDRVRITVQLIRAVDGFHVWSEIYDRTIDDIFAIQDEIAIKVGGALSASILSPGGGGKVASISTNDLDAYDLYLQARRERATFSFGGLLAAEELLKGALTIDPDFLEAKNELAGNYLDQSNTGLMNESDAFATALAITDQVLAARPTDAAARAIQIFVRMATFSGAEGKDIIFENLRELESIVAEHPSEYQARVFLTQLLHGLQQSEKALQLQLDALERDPYNARIHFEIGTLYLEMDQLDDARDALNKSIEIEPNQPNAYLRLAMAALQTGDGVEFLRQNLKSLGVDPRDHEIPGFIAGFLYQLDLITEGDDFQTRVNAIAPTSEVAYRIELLRAINTNDEEASIASARRAIKDNINDRQFAYGGAVQYLLRSAARNGTVAEESAYLEEQAPGILDIDADSIPNKYRNAQRIAFDAWYTTLSHEELMRRLDMILDFAKNLGINLQENSRMHVGVLALQGDTEQAIDIALEEIFTQPVTMHLGWRDGFAQAQYTEFVKDPRVIAAMQNWENEEEALRDRVRNFLLDLSSAPG
jgi:TolB-like protein/thioredoxin-like negative regulator of GroEL